MQQLKERILREGRVLPGNIVKVDGFLNHRVDTALMGVRNRHEADENCSATSWELTAEEIALLNEAVAEYERETPKEGSPAKR